MVSSSDRFRNRGRITFLRGSSEKKPRPQPRTRRDMLKAGLAGATGLLASSQSAFALNPPAGQVCIQCGVDGNLNPLFYNLPQVNPDNPGFRANWSCCVSALTSSTAPQDLYYEIYDANVESCVACGVHQNNGNAIFKYVVDRYDINGCARSWGCCHSSGGVQAGGTSTLYDSREEQCVGCELDNGGLQIFYVLPRFDDQCRAYDWGCCLNASGSGSVYAQLTGACQNGSIIPNGVTATGIGEGCLPCSSGSGSGSGSGS